MRKINRWHLTDAEREEIRRLSIEGRLSATAVASRMGITRNTVMRAKRAMGIPSRPPLPKKEILVLLRKGIAPRRVAKALGVSYRATVQFAWAHGFGKPRKKKLSGERLIKAIAEIVARRNSAAGIARSLNASYPEVLRLAHLILGCKQFLPSKTWPLTSYGGQPGPDSFAELVSIVMSTLSTEERAFLRTHPAALEYICTAVAIHHVPDALRAALGPVQMAETEEYFRARLRQVAGQTQWVN